MRRSLMALVTLLALGVHAAPVDPERMRALSEELRCLVCQNQSIAESQAPLAQDLREELERLIREGKTDTEIRNWMVARYGDFVLYRPPLRPRTWALWFGPPVLVLLGLLLIWALIRRQGRNQSPLPDIDERQLQAALKNTSQHPGPPE